MKKHSLLQYSKTIAVFLLISVITALFGFISYINDTDYVTVSLDDLKDITIIIDAGHGGEDGGAVGTSGALEKDINLKISSILSELFKLTDLNVVMTRTDDKLLYKENQASRKKYFDVRNRVEVAAAYNSPLFISIHQNKFPVAKYMGLQVYYSTNDPSGMDIARIIQDKTKEYLQPENNRNIKKGGKNIYLLDKLKCPAVLVECGFLSNPEDERNLGSDEYQKKIAFIIFSSVIDFLNDKYIM